MKRKITACLLAFLFAVSVIPAALAGGPPMDADWDGLVAVSSDTVDLSGGSVTRPAEDFYAVVCTLVGMAHFKQIGWTETKDGDYFDLDWNGTNDIFVTSTDGGITTTISRLNTCSLLHGRIYGPSASEPGFFPLKEFEEYMKSISAPGYVQNLSILMPSPANSIFTVTFTGFQYPKAGQTVKDNLSTLTASPGVYEFWPKWVLAEEFYPTLGDSDVFEAGKSYYLVISARSGDRLFAENVICSLTDVNGKAVKISDVGLSTGHNTNELDPWLLTFTTTGNITVPVATHKATKDGVSLHPISGKGEVTYLNAGDEVTLLDIENGWFKVECGGKVGWVDGQFLKPIPGVWEDPFVDIAERDYSYVPILWAYNTKPQVTNGINATHFGPNLTVTRGECVTFLWRSQGCPEPSSLRNPFVDVSSDKYYYKPVLWAVENHITKGVDATHFAPARTLSTAQILTFLYRTLEIGTDGWYQEAVNWAEQNDLMYRTGLQANPGSNCPRGAVVTFLYRTRAN